MSLQYYTKMMKALWSEKFLTADEMCGKDVLLVGLSSFGSDLVSVLQQPLFAAGAKVDYAPLFNEHIGVSSSLAQLEENVGGKKYDIVVLLEGLEKETHFVRSAEALAACCRLGGKLLLLVQTPDAADEALDVERFLEASWAYDLQDIASLFPGFALLSHMRTSPSFLLAARLEKRSEERPLRPTAYSLRLKRHVSERKGLQAGFFREFHELERLGVEELTDKCRYRHNYLQKYEFFLRDWKEKPLRLLELGVFKGGSERMWKRYFPQAEIYGVGTSTRAAAPMRRSASRSASAISRGRRRLKASRRSGRTSSLTMPRISGAIRSRRSSRSFPPCRAAASISLRIWKHRFSRVCFPIMVTRRLTPTRWQNASLAWQQAESLARTVLLLRKSRRPAWRRSWWRRCSQAVFSSRDRGRT